MLEPDEDDDDDDDDEEDEDEDDEDDEEDGTEVVLLTLVVVGDNDGLLRVPSALVFVEDSLNGRIASALAIDTTCSNCNSSTALIFVESACIAATDAASNLGASNCVARVHSCFN